jgi:hypothetical protein
MTQVVRYDRRPDVRAAIIAADWLAWMRQAGYAIFSSAEVNAAGLSMVIDVYRRDTPGIDEYALYHPDFPPGGLRATLYLLPDADAMDEMLQRAQVMVATLMTAEARRRDE